MTTTKTTLECRVCGIALEPAQVRPGGYENYPICRDTAGCTERLFEQAGARLEAEDGTGDKDSAEPAAGGSPAAGSAAQDAGDAA